MFFLGKSGINVVKHNPHGTMPDSQYLNVVDEEGNIIGTETREKIHQEGLLHREIHVWLYTPEGKVIFQHRGKHKDTFPDLLDASVGGHVEIGDTYESTALKELQEETGLQTDVRHLTFLQMYRSNSYDEVTGKRNNALRAVFAYKFEGTLADLKIETGKSEGFEIWPIKKLLDLSPEEQAKFVPGIMSEKHAPIFHKLAALTAA